MIPADHGGMDGASLMVILVRQTYNYQQGWYQAALECGAIDSLPTTTTSSFSGSCDTDVFNMSLEREFFMDAAWTSPVPNQAQAVIIFHIMDSQSGNLSDMSLKTSVGSNETFASGLSSW